MSSFFSFFFVSFSGESGNHSTREFGKVQKAMEITGMDTYCIPQSYNIIPIQISFLLFIVQVLPWIQGFEAKDQVLL